MPPCLAPPLPPSTVMKEEALMIHTLMASLWPPCLILYRPPPPLPGNAPPATPPLPSNVMKETALIRAAHNGHLHTVRRLLAAGAVIDAIDLVRGEGGNGSCVGT